MPKPHLIAVLTCLAATTAMAVVGPSLGPAVAALLYLLVVFVISIWLGRGPGLLASVLALVGLDYLFAFPYTLGVESIREGVTLLVFLLVAEVTSGLVVRARAKQAEAEERSWESKALYSVSDAMTRSAVPEEALQALPGHIVEIVGVPKCAIYLEHDQGALRVYASAGVGSRPAASIPPGAVDALRTRTPVKRDGLFVPVGVGERIVGVLYVGLGEPGGRSEATERLLETLAIYIGEVIERVRLWRDAAETEMLRKTNELKSSLISAVSHDLRTPLFSIRLAATSLLNTEVARDAGTRRELLRSIDTEAERLARLVANLLDLSRIEAGVLQPVKAWHDLHEVIARAADRLSEPASGPRAVVSEIAADVPLVSLDFTQIEDVLWNLLDNARRHSPQDRAVRVTAHRNGAEVVVQVENDGPAIPAAEAERVFDRFYTVPGAEGSSGLGLAICKGLIEAHGGRIWVERPGEPGARLAFALPVNEVPDEVGELPPMTATRSMKAG